MSKYNTPIDLKSRDSLNITLKAIKPSSRVLEFGPAHGDLTRYLKEELGCYVAIVEIDEESGAVASKYAEKALIGEQNGNIDKFLWYDEYKGMQFDYIIFNDVLEHLFYSKEVLIKSKDLLSKDGSILVTIPNIAHNSIVISLLNDDFKYTELGLLDNTHIRFFTRKTFIEICAIAGLTPVYETATYSGVGTNEVNYDYNSVCLTISKILKQRSLGEVYQYFFELKKTETVISNSVQRTIKYDYYNPYFECTCYVLPDSSDGYRETMTIKRLFDPDSGKIEIDLSGFPSVSGLRFDPFESNCIIKILKVFFEKNGGEENLKVYWTNALVEMDNIYIFNSTDPQFYFDLKNKEHPKKIVIEFVVLDFDIEEETFKTYELAASKIKNLTKTLINRDMIISDRDMIIADRDRTLCALIESTSWRLTRPIRFCSSLIKKIFRFEVFNALSGNNVEVPENTEKLVLENGSDAFDRNDYNEWVRRYDTLDNYARKALKEFIDEFIYKPLISIVMPVYNPDPKWLKEAIESVQKQIYPYWELCIADDASTNNEIRAIIEQYCNEDSRIKAVFREENGHISEASNSALKLVTGDYIALLDHDDLLSENALFWVADAINKKPDVKLIYSDEDKIDNEGKRSHPYFKCEWNPDLFYSHNLICHLGVYKTDLVSRAGGFRKGFEGAQDYDLALRFIERIESNQIVHIPRILYHWRQHAESTAISSEAKPYALIAGKKALSEHFERMGLKCTIELLEINMYRVRYSLPAEPPMVSLIIPTRNGFYLIKRCIESILSKTDYENYEIIIVDNSSNDSNTLKYFKELTNEPRIRIIRDERPFNYSALNNAAVKTAKGELVGLLNNDIEIITSDWLSELVSFAFQPRVGAVGARLWYPADTLQHGGIITGLLGIAGHSHRHFPRNNPGYFGRAAIIQGVSAVTAACMVIKKEIYEEVNGFNENDLKIAFNDVDFCLKVREAGYQNIWTPHAELIHYESTTRRYDDTPEKQKRFEKEVEYMKTRWGDDLLKDPAYNPNLTLDREDFSFAWPPR